MRAVLLVAAACLAVAGAPAHARAEARNPYAVAVIIGNKTYQDHDIPEVKYADRDAEAIRRYVIDVLGYDEHNIIYLENATQGRMLDVFGSEADPRGKLARWLQLDGSSDVLVYYSGHGMPGEKEVQSYLLPIDADPNSVTRNGYPLSLLYDNLKKLNAHSVTVLVDACFSGTSADGPLIRNASVVTRAATAAPSQGQARGMTVLTASQADQVANWDSGHKHGLFTEYFLEAVYGRADEPRYGGHHDGRITVGAVHSYLDREMSQVAQREGRDQNVTVVGEPEGVLAAFVPSQPPVRRDLLPPPSPPVTAAVVQTAPPVAPAVGQPARPAVPIIGSLPPPVAPPVRPAPAPVADPAALERQGEAVHRTGDVAGAARWFGQAAALGNVRAMLNLGRLYNGGWPGHENATAALTWFLRAAKANDPRAAREMAQAEYELGMMNKSANPTLARYWFERARQHGDPGAIPQLNRLSLANGQPSPRP